MRNDYADELDCLNNEVEPNSGIEYQGHEMGFEDDREGYYPEEESITDETYDEIIKSGEEFSEQVINNNKNGMESPVTIEDSIEISVFSEASEVKQTNEEIIFQVRNNKDLSEYEREYMLNDLAERNIKLVRWVVNRYVALVSTKEEMFTAGMYGYAKAIKAYDPNRGTLFSTFAIGCIKNEILFLMRKETKHSEKSISMETVAYHGKNGQELTLENTIPSKDVTPEQAAEISFKAAVIRELLKTLTPVERYVIVYRFGLDRGIEKTQKEIAEFVNMSQANISKIERSVTGRLRSGAIEILHNV